MRRKLRIGEHGKINIRKEKGIWKATAKIRTADGGYARRYAQARTKDEALTRLEERLTEAVGGETLNARLTLATLAEMWRKQMLTKGLAARTVDRYEWTLGKHIIPNIGDLEVTELSTSRIQKYLLMLTDKHGRSIAHLAKVVLTQILQVAVQDDLIPRNPARETTLPRAEKKPVRVLTPQQVSHLRSHLSGDVLDVFDLMLGTGSRISEVLAIRWEDIDYSQNKLKITGAIKRTKREGLHRGEPKSSGSIQWLYLPDYAMRPLKERARFCELVFCTSTGGFWEPTNFHKQWMKQLAGSEFEGVYPHMIRATVATALAEVEGVGVASRLLGHSNEAVTRKHYVARDDSAPDLAGALENIFQKYK